MKKVQSQKREDYKRKQNSVRYKINNGINREIIYKLYYTFHLKNV